MTCHLWSPVLVETKSTSSSNFSFRLAAAEDAAVVASAREKENVHGFRVGDIGPYVEWKMSEVC